MKDSKNTSKLISKLIKKKHKKENNINNQSGGFLPAAACVPCMAGVGSTIASGLGALGLGTAGAIGASKYMSRNSSSTISNGKINRKEKYEFIKNGKKKKYSINQNNKTITVMRGNKKRNKKFKTLKQANKYYNNLISKCKKNKTYKKC